MTDFTKDFSTRQRYGNISAIVLALVMAGELCTPATALDCKDGGSTQTEMNDCAFSSFKKIDAELNAKFTRLNACLGRSSADDKMFLDAQRAWLKFRDAECRFQASGSEGGSVQPMLVAGCLEGVTKDRVRELDYYVTCKEGDLSCPTWSCTAEKPPSQAK